MSATIEFNHNKNSFLEAISFDADRSLELDGKLNEMLAESKILKTYSEITERIAEEFSYQELIIVATMHIINIREGR